MIRRINIFANIDWLLVLLYFIFIISGWLNIYAAVYNEDHHSIFDISQRYGKQMLWIIFAIVIASIILLIDMNFYSFFAYFIYGFVIFLLISVLIFGKTVNGATSWFQIGSFLFQPSEFAKTATAIAIAKFVTSKGNSLIKTKNLFILLLIITAPALLILLQPDAGSTLIYSAFVIALYRQGLPLWVLLSLFVLPAFFVIALIWPLHFIILSAFIIGIIWYLSAGGNIKYLLSFLIISGGLGWLSIFLNNNYNLINNSYLYLILAGIAIFTLLLISLINKYKKAILPLLAIGGLIVFSSSVDYIVENLLREHQRNRIHIMLNPELDPQGYGYNLNQSKIAIGSGGFTGKGFLEGTQTKFNFVPEQSTDFIFCTIGEEWGFIGTSAIVILFLVFLLRIITVAERQRSWFSRIYGYSIAAVFFLHIAINISMTIGLFPVVGIPLPFFSYGGSSLWAFTILLFILINFDARRLEIMI